MTSQAQKEFASHWIRHWLSDEGALARKTPKVLAVASGGGHWEELRRMQPAWTDTEVTYLTTMHGYEQEVRGDTAPGGRVFVVPDANLNNRIRLLWQALRIAVIVLRLRPDVVISTGAAVGYFAIRFGKILGARTIWVDSIANAEELSMSGKMVGRHCDLWLTQWQNLSKPEGPHYAGAVL